jgi:hypothetical protein
MTHDLKTAHNAPSVKKSVVQFIFLDDIAIHAVEIFFGQELTRKEPRPAETFEIAAFRTGIDALRLRRLSTRHGWLVC